MDTNITKKPTKAPLLAIIPFFLVLLFFAGLSFVDSDADYSTEEARRLAQRPVFDLHQPEIIIDGLETYAVDQFPMRSKLLKAYSAMELAQGKVFSRDVFLEKGWIFSRAYNVADSGVSDLAAAAKSVAAKGIPTVYSMLPVKNYLVSTTPSLHVDDASEPNRQKFLAAFDGSEVVISDAAGTMAGQDEAVRMSQWYATDFHWNGDGAFAAAQKLVDDMAAAGLTPAIDLESCTVREVWDAGYNGDLTRRFSYLIPETQPVVVYRPADLSGIRYFTSLDDSVEVDRSTIVASGQGSGTADYSTAYTPNMACFRVENPNAAVDMRVVVFKDSLEDAMTDILTAAFTELVVVDARFTMPAAAEEVLGGADAAVFMFHQNNPAPDTAKYILGK